MIGQIKARRNSRTVRKCIYFNSNSHIGTDRGRYGSCAPVEGAGRTLRVLLAHAARVA
jgi:hypothetical protein